jgi:hypothetical protein
MYEVVRQAAGAPPGSRKRPELTDARVNDAADRARLRRTVERSDGERVPDEVSD